MKFAIYARKSKFTSSGESINNQITTCKNFIKFKFPDASDGDFQIFQDEDFSGKNTDRPEFQRMLKGIERKHFDFVACYRLDRISRSVNDFSSFIAILDKKGIQFLSVKEQFDTSTPMGKAMMNITAVFAQMERDTIAERIRDNMLLLAQTGRWLGGKPPKGFTSEKEDLILSNDKVKTSFFLKENQDIELIKIIYNKFLEIGNYNAVAKYMFDNFNLCDKNGQQLNSVVIKDILKNPVYCTADKQSFDYFSSKGCTVCFDKKDFSKHLGIIPYNRKPPVGNSRNNMQDWIIAIGKHKGVIKSSDWISVQNIMAKNIVRPRIHKSNGLLLGMIFCGLCGSRMDVRTDYRNKTRKLFCYICHNKHIRSKNVCSCKNLKGPSTDDKVINTIMNFDEKTLRKKLHSRKFSQAINKFKDQAEELHFQIIELQEQQDKYIKHLLKVSPDSPYVLKIQNAVNNIENKIEKLKLQKADFENKSQNTIEDKTDIDHVIKNINYLRENFYNLETDEKKSLLRLIIDKIIWNNEDLKIILNGEQ